MIKPNKVVKSSRTEKLISNLPTLEDSVKAEYAQPLHIEATRLAALKVHQRLKEQLFMLHPDLIGPKTVEVKRLVDDEKFQQRRDFVHLTVNFKDECYDGDEPVESLKKAFDKFLSRKWVRPVCYSFEFGRDGYHPHFHMVLQKTKPKSQGLREVFNTFKSVCDSPNYIRWQEVMRKDLKTVKAYVLKSRDKSHKKHNPNDEEWQLPWMYCVNGEALDPQDSDDELEAELDA